MDFLDLAKSRYSCRSFSDRPVDDETLNRVLEAAIVAPTAKNAQPVRVWVMKSEGALEKIKSVMPFKWAGQAQIVLAVGGKPDNAFVRPSDKRNFKDIDASIIATHIMLAVQALGLGTTWVGMFDSVKLKELFPQTEGYDMVALFPVGYPADDSAPSERHTIRKNHDELVEVL